MFRLIIASLLIALAGGCASTRGASTVDRNPQRVNSSEVRIERGRPNRLIDGTGWVLGIPSKLALWDRRADNHHVSAETEDRLLEYMNRNELNSALVRINQYDPLGEWKRLATSRQVGVGWRYTVGLLDMLKYTFLPGRIFGEDWYNPYTDTINIYSDIPALAMSEAAYAKDIRRRRHRGPYAAVQILPIVGMWHETIATKDVLAYVNERGDNVEVDETYRILYPAYGGNLGAGFGTFFPFGHAVGRLGGAAVGHTANGVRGLVESDHETVPTPNSDANFHTNGNGLAEFPEPAHD